MSKDKVDDSVQGEINVAYVEDDVEGETSIKKLDSIGNEKEMKYCILKNIILISISFVFLFTGLGVTALQSSLYQRLGTTSLWVIYAGLVFSCFFVPSLVIKQLKTKWTLPISMLGYCFYVAAQYYPSYYTFIPSAFVLGMAGAPLWSAKCSYLTQVGKIYARIVGESSEVIITRFFGIFFFFFQTAGIWGNLISSKILSTGVNSVARSEEFLEHCGANFCPSFGANLTIDAGTEEEQAAQKEDLRQKVVTMTSIYLVISLTSIVIVSLFVDPLSKFGIDEDEINKKTTKELAVATCTQMRNPNQALLIPLTMWSGLEQAFIGADFTAAFITCGFGIHMIGYVIICLGIFDSVFSICLSLLVKRVGRVLIFTLGAILNATLIVVMFTWRPNSDEIAVVFVLAALWGICDAIWQTQINAFYGVIFPGEAEAAFSNYRLWESIGFLFAFICSGVLCVNTKLYILLVVLFVGMAGYYTIEIILKRGARTKNEKEVITLSKCNYS